MRSGTGQGRRLTVAERAELLRRIGEGETFARAAAAVGCSTKSIQRLRRRGGGVKARMTSRAALRLSLAEREEISRGIGAVESYRAIAARLGRAPSTVARDVSANGGRRRYRAWRADGRALREARRPKVAKLARCARLREEVERRLKMRWSPQQIAARLIIDYPEDQEMRVSHETIYQSLFVQSRGALRLELARHLRTQRVQRRPRRRTLGGQGQLVDMVLISARPAEVADRAVPGHWEGDLLIGKAGGSAIGTLIERQSRYVMLLDLREGRLAEQVRTQLATKILELPAHLRRSLTWDRGKEMAEHVQFTIDTGVHVYFCDPHSPWQRGSNENANGLLRQYFPKGTDLSGYTADHLDAVAADLNARPRQTLGWMTPCEAFVRAVAMTG
jgi:transposase, IS30 family